MGQARNAVLINSADAVISIGKGHGTLSEIALALRAHKTVVSIGSWDVDPGIVAAPEAAGAVSIALGE